MCTHALRPFPLLLLLLTLTIPAGDASAQDRFWVGNDGIWSEDFNWTSDLTLPPPASVPTISSAVRIVADDATPRTISLTADASALNLHPDLANGRYDFDLASFQLRVRNNFYLDADINESNQIGIDGGELRTWNLEASGFDGGDAEIIVGPNANVELYPTAVFGTGSADASRILSRSPGALITVQGIVRLHDSVIGPLPPFIDITTGGLIRVEGGQIVNEGSMRVGSSFVGSDPTTSGGIQVGPNGFVDTTTELSVGRDGTGSVIIADGSIFLTRGTTSLGEESTGQGDVILGGAGNLSQWIVQDEITMADAGQSSFFVGFNGFLDASAPGATISVGTQNGSDGELLVRDQGLFDSTNPVYLGGTSSVAGGVGDLIARNGGAVTVADQIKVWGQGTLEADGGTVNADQIVTTSGSTLRVAGDGSIGTTVLNLAAGTNLDLQRGELAVVGPGASFLTGITNIAFGSTTGEPTIRLEDVIANVTNWQLGIGTGELARTVVTGEQGNLFASQNLRVAGGIGASNGTLEVLDGASASAGNDIVLGDGLGSNGTAIVQGVSSGGSRSLLRKNFGVAPEELIVGHRGTGNLTVLGGALVQSLSSMSLGSRADGTGNVTVSGASGGGIPSEISVSNDLAIAGSASNVGPGGAGLLAIETAGSVLVGDLTTVYDQGDVDVQVGGRLTTDRLHLLGGALQNDGIVDVGNTAFAVADGELIVADGGELVVDGGDHRFGSLRLQPGSTFDFRSGSLNVAGGTLGITTDNFAYGSSNGISTIEFSEGGVGQVVEFWRVGDLANTAGKTVVRDPDSRLVNLAGGANADIFVGYSGDGFMEVLDGGLVDSNDDITLAERSGSLGSALVRGKVDGQRARLIAGEAIGNVLIVGLQGDGDLTVADGGLAAAGDDVLVAWTGLGTGLVTVSGAAGDGTKATLSAGQDLLIGANEGVPIVDRGVGAVHILAGGEVDVHDLTLVGPTDQILLQGGTLRTGRLDLAGDPTRLDWQSGVLELDQSDLVIHQSGTLGETLTLATDMSLITSGSLEVVDAGVLTLAGGTARSSLLFFVEDGAFLRGAGTVEAPAGALVDGRLQPGNSAGRLTVTGNLVLGNTAETTIEIGGLLAGDEHDQIVVDGDLTLDGTLDVVLIDGFALGFGQEFVIFEVSGTLAGFPGLSEGAQVGTFGGEDLFISYAGGDGNDVMLYTQGTPVGAPSVPKSFRFDVSPNPFNPITHIAMDIPRSAAVQVDVFDVRGALVRRLLNEQLDPGRHELRFDGTDHSGRPLASGVYFARVRFDGQVQIGKMTLVK